MVSNRLSSSDDADMGSISRSFRWYRHGLSVRCGSGATLNSGSCSTSSSLQHRSQHLTMCGGGGSSDATYCGRDIRGGVMRILLGLAFTLHTSAKCIHFADVIVLPDWGEPAAWGPCGWCDGCSGECMFVLVLVSIMCGRRAYCCYGRGHARESRVVANCGWGATLGGARAF